MKSLKFTLPIATVNLIALVAYTFTLPEVIPIHANFAGEIDGWGSRYTVLILAILPVLLALGMVFYRKKTGGNPKISRNRRVENIILVVLYFFFVLLSWFPAYLATVGNQDSLAAVELLLGVPLGIIMIVFGNYSGTIRQNRYLGIRTPWTLKNEEVWRKTHRLGSYYQVAGGIVLLFSALLAFAFGEGLIFFVGFLLSLLLVAFLPMIYSYLIYRRLTDEK